MADGRISITIDVTGNAAKDIKTFTDRLNKLKPATTGAASGMAKLGFSVIALNQAMELFQKLGRPIIAFGKQLLETTDKFRRMEIALTSLTGSVTFAKNAFKRLVDLSRETPFTLEAMTDSFVRLKSTGVKDTERVLRGIVNAVSAFGGTEQDIKLVALAFQQMAGKGVVSMEELRRQLGERVPTAMRILARELDLTLPQLFSKVEKGALDSFEAIEALTRGFEKDFGGAAERMLNTWSGSTAKLVTSWQLFMRTLGEAGALDAAISTVNDLAFSLDNLTTSLIEAIEAAEDSRVDIGEEIAKGILTTPSLPILGFFAALFNISQKSTGSLKEFNTVVIDGAIALKAYAQAQAEATKKNEKLNTAGLKAAGVYKKGASGLKAWNKQLEFSDPLVANATFMAKQETAELERLEQAYEGVAESVKKIDQDKFLEGLSKSFTMLDASITQLAIYDNSLASTNEFIQGVINSFDAEEIAVLAAKDAILQMMDVEFRLATGIKKTTDEIEKQTAALKKQKETAFLLGQAKKIGGQIIGVSGAIQGGQQAGLPGAIVGALTDILLASPKMQEAIAKINETIIRVFEPIVEALIPILDAMQPALEEIGILLKELAPILKPLIKILIFNLKIMTFVIGKFISVYRVGLAIAQGIWGILKKLWDIIKNLIDALKNIGKGVSSAAETAFGATVVGRALGFHQGGVIQQQDLLRTPGMRPNEGLILAKAGEQVLTPEQQQQGSVYNFHINAISPRESANEIRNVIQELQVQGLLGV